jgi:hypothetical protein
MARTVLKWDLGTIEFDAVTEEAPDHDADITDYPIEGGSTLTENIRVKPLIYRMTVTVSNDPARERGLTHLDGATALTGVEIKVRKPLIPGPPVAQVPTSFGGFQLTREATVRANVRTWNPAVRRVTNVYAELLNAQAEGRLFTIATDIGNYDRMALQSIRPSRSAQNYRAPKFDLAFKQITTAKLIRRDVSSMFPKPKNQRSNPPQDAGKQQAVEADKATGDDATVLWNIFD